MFKKYKKKLLKIKFKNRVITCQDLANLKESKRRLLLNKITDEQYEDVIYVLTMMPKLEITTKIEGKQIFFFINL